MRYTQNRQQSAEIFRAALTQMSRHEAGFHPTSYALWYEHTAGLNPELTRALETRLVGEYPLSDDEAWKLHSQYIIQRDIEAFERVQEQLCGLLQQAAHATGSADAAALQFSDTLADRETQLARPAGAEAIRDIVSGLLRDTRRLRATTLQLSEQLHATTREVQTLTEQLTQARTEALHDPLTGLYNRRGFERAIAELYSHPDGLAGSALLLVDIDHFKSINDTHGHLFGDQVLRAVAQILRDGIKGRDIAARLGGEEFGVLLPETYIAGAAAVAEQIRSAVARGRIRRVSRNETIGNVTVSVGVARASAGETIVELIERADAAMYEAKRAGRNRVSAVSSASPSRPARG